MKVSLPHDFKEFVALLNDHDVRYLIVGGYAVSFHGHPRYTKDLDVWIDSPTANVERLLKALDEFGFAELNLSVEDFQQPGQIIQLGREPVRIDLLTSVKGLDFDGALPSRLVAKVEEVEVAVVGLADLKTSKQAAGRPQDIADLDHLG